MLVLAACKNEKNTAAQAEEEGPEMVEEDEIDVVPNSTDLDFDAAMAAYRKKDFETASRYITTAIDDLKRDGAAVNAKSKKELETTIASLQSLAEKVKAGEVTGEEELEALFAHVDMMTSHDYLLLTQVYAVDAPEKMQSAFRKAGERMERATQKLDGEAKAEGEKILGAIKTDLGKTDIKANEIGNAAGKRVEEMAGWMKMQAEKLGIKAPEHSDF
jgi:hypothetical protein